MMYLDDDHRREEVEFEMTAMNIQHGWMWWFIVVNAINAT